MSALRWADASALELLGSDRDTGTVPVGLPTDAHSVMESSSITDSVVVIPSVTTSSTAKGSSYNAL
jgi:hypothetical protein